MVLIDCTVKTANITERVELQSIARMCVGGKACFYNVIHFVFVFLFILIYVDAFY